MIEQIYISTGLDLSDEEVRIYVMKVFCLPVLILVSSDISKAPSMLFPGRAEQARAIHGLPLAPMFSPSATFDWLI